MKSISKLATLLLAFAVCLGLSSCNDDNNKGLMVPDDVLYDYVTMVSTGEKGTVFEFRKNGDSSLITLTASVELDKNKVKAGQRIIIQYRPSGGQQAYQSGPIDLYGIVLITNGDAEIKPIASIDAISDGQMTMRTIARSGQYIDVWIEATISKAPATFGIYVDEATINDEYPVAYLKFVTDRIDVNQRNQQIYGSFDVKSVLDMPSCKGLVVKYISDKTSESVRFDKDIRVPINPTE